MANENQKPMIYHDSVVKLNSTDFIFVEGPAWDSSKYIFFSDIPASKIYKYSKSHGIEVFVESEVNTNGIFYKFGRLYVCESGGRQLVTYDLDGTKLDVLTDDFNGEPFNSPNDLFVDDSGGVYFTDPSFGQTPVSEESVYYMDPRGNTSRIVTGMTKPNGIILTNDHKKLIVSDTYDRYVYCWDVISNGIIENKQIYCTLGMEPGKGNESGADGMTMDRLGFLYVTTSIGIQVFDTAGAIHDTIILPERPTNCTFGGDSLNELYITARKGLYMVPVKFPTQSSPPAPTRTLKQQAKYPVIKVIYNGNGATIYNIPSYSKISLYNLQGKLLDKFTCLQDNYEVEKTRYKEKFMIVKVEGMHEGNTFIASRKILL